MIPSLLSVERLSVSYGRVPAVTEASISVGAGEIVTVIGANGAGKSTFVNALMGLLPSRGTVHLAGDAIQALPVEERVLRGLCLVPERRELFATMPVIDNLILGGWKSAADERQRTLAEVFARFPRLKQRRTQLAGTLSGGERQMLAMGRALMSLPKVLMLDEPSLGLAPKIVAEIFAIIADLRRSGVSVLLIEQNARAALAAADRAYVMELGAFTLSGPAAELAQDPRIAGIYLGEGVS